MSHEIAAHFFRFSFVSNGFIWFGHAATHLVSIATNLTQRKMLQTIVGRAVDSTDWKTTMQRMNEKLDAALRYTSFISK